MSAPQRIADWWSAHPMTYAKTHGEVDYGAEEVAFGSAEFFAQADRRLLQWNAPLHGSRPFDRLFPYGDYAGKPVLEIGCGMGAMASFWARSGARVTAVDLAERSIEQTRRRFELFGLSADIRQADARRLPFPDASFDFVYSWGVLHHSPDLRQSIAEMMRVLKPGGGFGVMLYHRHSFLYGYTIRFVEGFLHNENRFLDPQELANRYTDGAREEGNPHTWPITKSESRRMFGPYSQDLKLKVLGTDLDGIFPYVVPGLGQAVPAWLKKPWARRFGWSLWSYGRKA